MSEPCKVFLSSTGADLQAWRDAAFEAIQLAGATCIRMEDFNADPRPPAEVCAAEVLRSSMLVGLIGFHYGGRVPPERDRSFTQMEIETARASGIDCFLYVAPDNSVNAVGQTGADLDAQTAFRKTLLETLTVGRREHWSDKYRLALRIQAAVFKRCRPDAPDIERYAAGLKVELQEKAEAAAEARPEDVETALKEKAAVEAKLADIESAYAGAQETIAGLRRTIEQYGNDLGADRLARAEAALDEKDFDTADALLREIEDAGELEVLRVANAAFQRGKIAEEQVRWADAAEHYGKAARLAPNFQHLRQDWDFAWKLGDFDRALRVATVLYETAVEDFGEASHEAGVAVSCHAVSLKDLGRYADAEPLYRQALELDEQTDRMEHPAHAIHLNNLAGLLNAMGRYAEAEPLFRQALEIDAKTIGTAHPDYAIHLNNLAGLLRDMGRFDEAEPLYAQMMPILRDKLGDDHPNTKQGAANYARLLRAHFPDDPALKELEAAFGAGIGR